MSARESVWDYPRPPRVERSSRRVRIVLGGEVIADTARALRVLETSHPPAWYVPLADIAATALTASFRTSVCEYKGGARYFDVTGGDKTVPNAAWHYPDPAPGFLELRDHVCFYPGLMDECTVDGERVRAQAGGFYGGWITDDVEGPFKGEPGTRGW